MEWQQKGPNYYIMLDVTRSSSPLEIKRSFKKLSLQLHPDKNPSPDASSQFDTVKKAYDSLMDLELREVYNKFGHEGIQTNKRFNEQQFLLEVAIYYVSYGMLTFLLTMSKRSGEARNWALTGLMASNPIPAWLAPQMTEHEVVWLLHSIYPAFMNGCRSLGSYLYVDLDAQTRQFLMALNEQNKDILLVLRELQLRVAEGAGAMGASASRLVGGGGEAVAHRVTPTGKLKELQDRLRNSNTSVAQAVTQLKPDKSGSSNMGFYLMILGYIVVSYVFSS
jgi:curved DNA-binding protein CbpA